MAQNEQQGSYWTKLANDVLEAAEQIATRMDEGIAVLMNGGEATSSKQANPEQPAEAMLHEEEEYMNEFGGSPLEGMADSVIGDIMANQAQPETFTEHFHAFRHAITWREPFIMGLVAFQVFMFLVTLWVSRKDRGFAPRLVVMLTIGVIVRCSERLNLYGAQNWESFSTQNYFDQRGIFSMVMVCCPLLLDSLLLLIMLLREAAQLLVLVKTAEIKKKRKESSEKKKKSQ